MGCDIHFVAEFKAPAFKGWNGMRFDLPRDYRMFACLAGVRGLPDEAIVDPRGFPSELSFDSRWEKEKMDDIFGHTPSWLTLNEFSQAINKAQKDSIDYDDFEYIPYEYIAVNAAMRELEQRGCEVRLVFWFDN